MKIKKRLIIRMPGSCLGVIVVLTGITIAGLYYLRWEYQKTNLEQHTQFVEGQITDGIKTRGEIYINLPIMWGTPKKLFVGRYLEPLHGLDKITSIHISAPNEPFPKEGMKHLASLPDLEWLFFQDTPFDGDAFTPFFETKSLKKLEFQNCSFEAKAILSLQTLAGKQPDIEIRHLGPDRRIFL